MLVLVLAAGAAILWGPTLWDRFGDEVLPSGRCTVTLGDRSDTKTAEQANNIALIVAGSIRHGLPARAASIRSRTPSGGLPVAAAITSRIWGKE